MTTDVLIRRPTAGSPALVPGSAMAAVGIRPLERGDAAAVRAVFAGMGARSRALRFLSPKPRLTDRDVRVLTAVDGHNHVAVLATSPADGAPIGIARFVRSRDDAGAAEVAVAVVDAWQRRRVGTMLLGALACRAGELGVRRFEADVASDNVAVLNLLQRSGGRWSWMHVGRGVAEVEISLEEVRA